MSKVRQKNGDTGLLKFIYCLYNLELKRKDHLDDSLKARNNYWHNIFGSSLCTEDSGQSIPFERYSSKNKCAKE